MAKGAALGVASRGLPGYERLRRRWQDLASPRRGDLLARMYSPGADGLVVHGFPLIERAGPDARLVIGRDVILATGIALSLQAPRAELHIGDGVFVNRGAQIDVRERVTIGAGCNIGFGVTILDTDFHPITGAGPTTQPVTIGDDVLICAHATVLKGVTIGPGAVVGAGSVVSRDVPPRTLVAGAPARVVREEVTWAQGRYDPATRRRDDLVDY